MALIENYKRRCGNTTRQVDEWIQQLFNGEVVVINDHANRYGNNANENAKIILLRRLEMEHRLKPGTSSPLQLEGNTIKLLSF